jgi:hypothetical protein
MNSMLVASFGVGEVVNALLWFFLFFIGIWLMISVFIDTFRGDDLKGWVKAVWLVVVVAFISAAEYQLVKAELFDKELTRQDNNKSQQ